MNDGEGVMASRWTFPELVRIAHLQGCQQLADRARCGVSTYGERYTQPGDLLEEALRLVGDAEDVLRLAVAAERARATSWEQIGETLGISRQSAHERYAKTVEEIDDGILFPQRESETPDGPGWWACPGGVEDPDLTVRRLDEWAHRHRERFDPDRGEHPVSENLRQREDLAAISAVGMVPRIARRIAERDLPAGVSEPIARRVLLEHKLAAFTMIAGRDRGKTAQDAHRQADETREQLLAWHREDLTPRITVQPVDDPRVPIDAYRFMLYGQPIAELAFTADSDLASIGWFLTRIDPDGWRRDPENFPGWQRDTIRLPIDGADAERVAGIDGDDQVMLELARQIAKHTQPAAVIHARDTLITRLADERVAPLTDHTAAQAAR